MNIADWFKDWLDCRTAEERVPEFTRLRYKSLVEHYNNGLYSEDDWLDVYREIRGIEKKFNLPTAELLHPYS